MSTTSSDVSQASTKVNDDAKSSSKPRRSAREAIKHAADSATAQDVLFFLIAFRILNALSIRTFFQPDEYFQSLEPAWEIAFGPKSGAWITWEWREHLRSAIHPTLFAALYRFCDSFAEISHLNARTRAELLVAAPKVLQAISASLTDYQTWAFARKIYGNSSQEAWAALALTIVSPWQWFCSTRTLSNGLETTLTVVALTQWPWHWGLNGHQKTQDSVENSETEEQETVATDDSADVIDNLRQCLLLAAVACLLRPTNIFIWIFLSAETFLRSSSGGWLVPLNRSGSSFWVQYSYLPSWRTDLRKRLIMLRQGILCGGLVLLFALLIDRIYYQSWVFPPLKFLYFNVVQRLAVFYGRNDWHYYLTQGLPLLLTTAFPFALPGIYQALTRPSSDESADISHHIEKQLAALSIFVTCVMSLLSHKEVRFIYPLLPGLHILAAPILVQYFLPALDTTYTAIRLPPTSAKVRRGLFFFLLIVNFLIASYTTIVHAQGPITVLDYLRDQHIKHYLPAKSTEEQTMTVGFLMPCHSTPWRSHLVFSTVEAWALSCEPPLHMNSSEKAMYLDEADQFYADPTVWLRTHMARHPPRPRRLFSGNSMVRKRTPKGLIHADSSVVANMNVRREWPDYLVFFEQLGGFMRSQLRESGYRECWRGFNTRWHDDWRRQGDILVWCLWPERKEEKINVQQELADKATRATAKMAQKTKEQAAKARNQIPLQKGKSSKPSSQKGRSWGSWWPQWPLGQKKTPRKESSKDLWA